MIAYKPQQTYLIELQNFEEISYEQAETRLHLRANNVNSGVVFGIRTHNSAKSLKSTATYAIRRTTLFELNGHVLNLLLAWSIPKRFSIPGREAHKTFHMSSTVHHSPVSYYTSLSLGPVSDSVWAVCEQPLRNPDWIAVLGRWCAAKQSDLSPWRQLFSALPPPLNKNEYVCIFLYTSFWHNLAMIMPKLLVYNSRYLLVSQLWFSVEHLRIQFSRMRMKGIQNK